MFIGLCRVALTAIAWSSVSMRISCWCISFLYISAGNVMSFWLAILTHWVGTHFSLLCSLRHRSGLGFGGSQSRTPGMDSEWPEFMTYALRLVLPKGEKAVPQALFFSEGLGLSPSAFLGECRWSLKHFWNCREYVVYGPAPGSRNKKVHVLYLCVCGVPNKFWYVFSN